MSFENQPFLFYYYREKSIERVLKVKKFALENKKITTAETVGYLCGVGAAYFTMTYLNDFSISENWRLFDSFLVKSSAWFLGNVGTYKIVETFQEQKEHVKQKELIKNNIFGCSLAFGVKFLGAKGFISLGMEPENAVGIIAMIGGPIPSLLRQKLNIKSNILKVKSLDGMLD